MQRARAVVALAATRTATLAATALATTRAAAHAALAGGAGQCIQAGGLHLAKLQR